MDPNLKKAKKIKKHAHNCVAEQCGAENDDGKLGISTWKVKIVRK